MLRHSAKFRLIPGLVALFAVAFAGLCLAGTVDVRLGLAIAWAIVGFAAISLVVAVARK